MSTEIESLNPGDTVYTYVKRGSETPLVREGIVQAILEMPSVVPQAQYVLMVDGVLIIRDKYTCATDVAALQTYDKVGESHLYHD
jgi:hypothetical protein